MFTRLDYSSALEYSIIRRYTNIVYYYNSASKENIVRTMCGFFKSDELRAAKSLIYERFRSFDILENAADRRTTENRSDLMAICCDLIDDLFKLEENNIQVCVCCF